MNRSGPIRPLTVLQNSAVPRFPGSRSCVSDLLSHSPLDWCPGSAVAEAATVTRLPRVVRAIPLRRQTRRRARVARPAWIPQAARPRAHPVADMAAWRPITRLPAAVIHRWLPTNRLPAMVRFLETRLTAAGIRHKPVQAEPNPAGRERIPTAALAETIRMAPLTQAVQRREVEGLVPDMAGQRATRTSPPDTVRSLDRATPQATPAPQGPPAQPADMVLPARPVDMVLRARLAGTVLPVRLVAMVGVPVGFPVVRMNRSTLLMGRCLAMCRARRLEAIRLWWMVAAPVLVRCRRGACRMVIRASLTVVGFRVRRRRPAFRTVIPALLMVAVRRERRQDNFPEAIRVL